MLQIESLSIRMFLLEPGLVPFGGRLDRSACTNGNHWKSSELRPIDDRRSAIDGPQTCVSLCNQSSVRDRIVIKTKSFRSGAESERKPIEFVNWKKRRCWPLAKVKCRPSAETSLLRQNAVHLFTFPDPPDTTDPTDLTDPPSSSTLSRFTVYLVKANQPLLTGDRATDWSSALATGHAWGLESLSEMPSMPNRFLIDTAARDHISWPEVEL